MASDAAVATSASACSVAEAREVCELQALAAGSRGAVSVACPEGSTLSDPNKLLKKEATPPLAPLLEDAGALAISVFQVNVRSVVSDVTCGSAEAVPDPSPPEETVVGWFLFALD